jgi:hypothetical protein
VRGAELLAARKYRWKSGYRLRGNPTLVGQRIEQITQRNGRCTREDIYTDARRRESPFRRDLYAKTTDAMIREWRLEKASEILRAIQVVEIEVIGGTTTEVAAPLVSFIPDREYMLTTHVLRDVDLRKERLAQIIHELEAFRYKLHGFKQLVAMVDRVIARAKKLRVRK